MRKKNQTAALVVCIAALAIQFSACKKDGTTVNDVRAASSNDNAMADSTTDSSLLKGLVAWYTFNGDDSDHSGKSNNVIFNSAIPATGKLGIPNTAYYFDGVSSYMQVNDKKSLNPNRISLYALIRPMGFYEGTCHKNEVIAKEDSDYDNGQYFLGFDDDDFYHGNGCYDSVAAYHERFTGSYGDGTDNNAITAYSQYIKLKHWYSLVYTYDGLYSKYYVNGVLVSKVAKSTIFTPNNSPLFFGKTGSSTNPSYFNGFIDEIRIYNKPLNAKQVTVLYNQSIAAE